MKGYDYKRYNLRFNVDYQATDWLTIKPKVWATRSDVMDQQQDLGAIMYVNFPWDSPYDENGDLIQQYRPTDWVNSDATNYLYDLQWNYEKKTSYEFMGNFDFDIKFTDWLTFASVNSYKYNNILFKGYNDPRSKAGEATMDCCKIRPQLLIGYIATNCFVLIRCSINIPSMRYWLMSGTLIPGKSRIRQRLVSLRVSPWQM